MADFTIHGKTETTSMANADEFLIWVAGSAVTRRITKANALSGYPTAAANVLTLPDGKQLTVPATGTAALVSSGSYTPELSFNFATTGITYGTRIGQWVRFENVMHVWTKILLSSKGSATGIASITLPLASRTVSNLFYAASTLIVLNVSYVGTMGAYVDSNSNALRLRQLTEAGANSALTDANFANNSEVSFQITYLV